MNKLIIESIIRKNYVFLWNIKNCGDLETFWKVYERFPFITGSGNKWPGVHATTLIETCGMWCAEWALRYGLNKEVSPTVKKIMERYCDAQYYISEPKKTLVKLELEKELKEVLGKPPIDQEMCVFQVRDYFDPGKNFGWVLYSKDGFNKGNTTIVSPLL